MFGCFSLKLSISKIPRFLHLFLRVFIISLSITSASLSITLYLLRNESMPKSFQNMKEKILNEAASSCKMTSTVSVSNSLALSNFTSESLIITRSALHQTSHGIFLKILMLKKCSTDVSNLRLEFDFKQVVCPIIKHIESDECPWYWAPGCKWSSFIASTSLTFIPQHIYLHYNGHKIKLPVEPTHYVENMRFALCIQPIYWHVDWLQIIEFIEIWMSQGVSHFFFYVHTSTNRVMEILQYYEAKGILTIIPWRSFPKTKHVNPNKSVYRLAHSLANNDCLWRSQGARFVAFVDLDEYILTMNGQPLLEYLKVKSKLCPRCGSFTAIHRKMHYSSIRPKQKFNWKSVNFGWLTNISYGFPEPNGPHKQVVRPQTVSIISTHSTRKSNPGYIEVNLNSSEVALMHVSYKWSENMPENVNFTNGLFSGILPSLKKAYVMLGEKLFGNQTVEIENVVKMEVAKCIQRWYHHKCKVVEMCSVDSGNVKYWLRAEDLGTVPYQTI